MYAFFYPENKEQLHIGTFPSVDEAKAWWEDRRSTWQEISSRGDDLAAYLSTHGEIVVIREIDT